MATIIQMQMNYAIVVVEDVPVAHHEDQIAF